jgi:hypothetical protein
MARSSSKRVVDINDFAQINRCEPTRPCCNAHACSSTPSALSVLWAAEREASTCCIRALRFSAYGNDTPPKIVHYRSMCRQRDSTRLDETYPGILIIAPSWWLSPGPSSCSPPTTTS